MCARVERAVRSRQKLHQQVWTLIMARLGVARETVWCLLVEDGYGLFDSNGMMWLDYTHFATTSISMGSV